MVEHDSSAQYLHALFRSASNVITIGYGVEAPLTAVDLALVFVSMALGASLWALMMGATASLLQRKDATSSLFVQHLQLWKVLVDTIIFPFVFSFFWFPYMCTKIKGCFTAPTDASLGRCAQYRPLHIILQDYSRQHSLPATTRAKGLTALELRFHSRRLIDDAVVLRYLHPALRADIVWEAQRALVDASGLLQACRYGFHLSRFGDGFEP